MAFCCWYSLFTVCVLFPTRPVKKYQNIATTYCRILYQFGYRGLEHDTLWPLAHVHSFMLFVNKIVFHYMFLYNVAKFFSCHFLGLLQDDSKPLQQYMYT
jgi:hypothetical protein